MLVSSIKGVRVSFTAGVVWPWEKEEFIDLTLKILKLDVVARCRDGKGALIKAVFQVRVNITDHDILQVARVVGCDRTFEQDTVALLFTGGFEAAVRAAAGRFDYARLTAAQEEFQESVREIIGLDLNGYHLEDVAVQEILPQDDHRFALGRQEMVVGWIELKAGIELCHFLSQYPVSVLAIGRADGSLERPPKSDAVLVAGEGVAVGHTGAACMVKGRVRHKRIGAMVIEALRRHGRSLRSCLQSHAASDGWAGIARVGRPFVWGPSCVSAGRR